jgi:hypothetical protein
LIAGGFTEFTGYNFFCHSMKEIRICLTAIRMRSNDLSVTAAIGCTLYINSNRNPEETEPITDYSQFLPFPAEFQQQVEKTSQSLKVSPETAKMILSCYHIFNNRTVGVISVNIDEIRRIASQ